MNLLILTQKVDKDDSNLGFFHSWIAEFSKHFEKVLVVCLYKGKSDLPENVRVISLGKEDGQSRVKYLLNFYSYIWFERKNYDKVFVHMNQVYVLLGGLIWKALGKDVYLWYTHKSITTSLRGALVFVKKVFSASTESFRIKTNKINIMGHGIDIDLFAFDSGKVFNENSLKVVTVGRISQSKDLVTILKAIRMLTIDVAITFDIVGSTITKEDILYFDTVKKYVSENGLSDIVMFHGAMPQEKVIPFLYGADVFIHTSITGSLDKAGLEPLSCGIPVLSSNDALVSILSPYGLTFKSRDAMSLVTALKSFMRREDKKEISQKLRDVVVQNHSLKSLISRLSDSVKN